MLTTKKESPAIQATGKTAEEIISELLVSLPAQTHLNNLHTMLVGWLRNLEHDPEADHRKESVYLTYYVLKNMLHDLEEV